MLFSIGIAFNLIIRCNFNGVSKVYSLLIGMGYIFFMRLKCVETSATYLMRFFGVDTAQGIEISPING
jgi:hypothetical protein